MSKTSENIDWDLLFGASDKPETSSTLTIQDVELELKKEELESRRQDRRQRGRFSVWIFGFMGVYMIFILVVLILSGCHVLRINDAVLISLLSTTTADVIGIFIIVAKYLFHKPNN